MPICVSAQKGKCGDNVTWSFDKKTGILTISGTGPMKDFEGRWASKSKIAPWFKFSEKINKVVIEEGVTSIGNFFFTSRYIAHTSWNTEYIYPGVTSVSIPNTVTSIGNDAFKDCIHLKSIEIPSSLTSIGDDAFAGPRKVIIKDMASWCGINLGNMSSNPLHYAGHLYSDENTEITELIIPNGVTSISYSAFAGCESIKSVIIPEGVKSIGESAFRGCSSLMSVQFPQGLIDIKASAFKDCKMLNQVNIPSNVMGIHAEAFEPTTKLIREEEIAVKQEKKEKQEKTNNSKKQVAKKSTKAPVLSAVDRNVPTSAQHCDNTFAVIIGSEKYDEEADVPFAENDAKIFGEYCKKTLGINEKHIRRIYNATYNDFRKAVNWLKQGLSVYEGKGRVIFYYAGHGIPSETDKSAYLLPVDGIASDIGSAYSLQRLYQALGELPAQSVTVFLDACFSGTKRDGTMLASARGVAIKTKPQEVQGKMVVFSAAQGDETAYPYNSQQHGMFTYHLLKKLQQTKGNVTLGELGDYLTREVKRASFNENSKVQTPTVSASETLSDSWREMKLK